MSSLSFGSYDQRRMTRWYFGGIASSFASALTHPLDLLKVLKQTQIEDMSTVPLARKIIREQGVSSLYNGISASLMRQCTYTLARFGVYTIGTRKMDTSTMVRKTLLAAVSGFGGGIVGAPADLLNVRMQSDVKLPPDQRRNYKHVVDGLIRICQEEGWRHLFNGAFIAAIRGMFMTVGQIAFYEESKDLMVENFGFKPNMNTYITAAIISAIAATTLTQPMDVVKTRRMNAKAGEYSGITDVFVKTAKEGPLAFYKGYGPSFSRILPHTVLLFLGLEYLRTHFGYVPESSRTTK